MYMYIFLFCDQSDICLHRSYTDMQLACQLPERIRLTCCCGTLTKPYHADNHSKGTCCAYVLKTLYHGNAHGLQGFDELTLPGSRRESR